MNNLYKIYNQRWTHLSAYDECQATTILSLSMLGDTPTTTASLWNFIVGSGQHIKCTFISSVTSLTSFIMDSVMFTG